MILDYRFPDEIDPSEVEGIAEACDGMALEKSRNGAFIAADDLRSAAKLLRLLAEASNPTPGDGG